MKKVTNGETKGQHLILGGPTKSLLDEAVQTFRTKVETVISI